VSQHFDDDQKETPFVPFAIGSDVASQAGVVFRYAKLAFLPTSALVGV